MRNTITRDQHSTAQAATPGRRGLLAGAVGAGIALVAVVLYALTQPNPTAVLGAALLIALAAATAGGMVGFLFGIPRTRGAEHDDARDAGARRPRYDANTNLEQVSDWLTKILIGVGLVELGTLLRAGNRLVAAIAPALGDGPQSRVTAGATLIFFVVGGFLAGWLLTRMLLAPALSAADSRALAAFVAAEAAAEAGDRDAADELRAEGIRLVRRATETAGRYEEVRRRPATAGRTAEMEALVADARAIASADAWNPDQVRDLYRQGRDGGRIFALALMEGNASLIDVECALDAVTGSRSAFDQFHALLVLEAAVPAMTPDDRTAALRALDEQTGPHGRIHDNTGRRRVVDRIRDALGDAATTIPSARSGEPR